MAGRQQPVILEKLLTLSLANLRGLGFMDKAEGYKSLPVVIKKASGLCMTSDTVLVTVSTQAGNSYIKFDCSIDDQPLSYRLPLVQVVNYLTGGFTYYFKCIEADKICRKLYFYQNKWVCRSAIKNRYYFQNILPKQKRGQYEAIKRLHSYEKIIAECGKKGFRPYRYGQQTSRMKKIIRAKSKLERMSNYI